MPPLAPLHDVYLPQETKMLICIKLVLGTKKTPTTGDVAGLTFSNVLFHHNRFLYINYTLYIIGVYFIRGDCITFLN